MAVIVLASAAGSPGVTTSAFGLALTWPRPVLLIEADPTGGSAMLAGFFRGTTAQTTGLLDLAWAHRQGLLADALAELPMPISPDAPRRPRRPTPMWSVASQTYSVTSQSTTTSSHSHSCCRSCGVSARIGRT